MTAPFEVRVLRLPATPAPGERARLLASLTPAEEQHRARFVRPADADRFLVGRGTLRCELGRTLGLAARDVPLAVGPHGKPVVAGGSSHVNVSHAGDVVLVALSAGAALGVDVERHDARAAAELAPADVFSAREAADLAALPATLRVAAFFHTWTTREAIGKALGVGLGLSREAFDVDVDPRRPPGLVAARTPEVAALTVVPIAVPPGYVAALAVLADRGAFRVTVA